MPARSNPFQHLIFLIQHQLAAQEVSVTESKLVQDGEGHLREIDVAVEGKIGGHPIFVAVECRDQGRAANIGWIDELIGKYSHLPVDKVVAVSRRGFTKAARE